MKKIILIAFLILTGQIFANEFKVNDFTLNPDSKIAIRYPRFDQNKQPCALILIETKLREIIFASDQTIIGDIQLRQGRFYLYVPASTTTLKFSKEGFDTLEYKLPISLKASSTYTLTLEGILFENPNELITQEPSSTEMPAEIKPIDSTNLQLKQNVLLSKDPLNSVDSTLIFPADSIPTPKLKQEIKPINDTLIKR